MAKQCDNTSVGILIEDEHGRSVIIERRNYPEAFAPIAGHQDGLSPHDATVAETQQEGGLTLSTFVKIFEEDIANPCKREGGSHHQWTVFGAHEWTGLLKAGDDAKKARWMNREELLKAIARTEYFIQKYGISSENVNDLTRAIFGDPEKKSTDPEWKEEMGLEPVWYYIFKKLGKI